MPTYTTTYSLGKPVVGADEDAWGDTLNASLDSIDDILDGTTPVTGIDINSGTLDGVTIGGTTAGAGTFTTLTANTSITGTLATAAQPNVTSLGTLTSLTVSGDVSFGDNDKAIFGAGSDLQIYHSGSHSYIDEVGTGSLLIRAEDLVFQNSDGSENYGRALANGAFELNYDAVRKLATTNTGVDITGTLTSDGLTVQGSGVTAVVEASASNAGLRLSGLATNAGARNWDIRSNNAAFGDLVFLQGASQGATPSVKRMSIDVNGDISFYEDTGTTAKFFWDASAESLGIGTSSPQQLLEITGSTPTIRLSDSRGITWTGGEELGGLEFYTNDGSANGPLLGASITALNTVASTIPNYNLIFSTAPHNDNTGPVERMRIDSSGNVGIGTNTASQKLHVQGNAQVNGYIFQDNGTNAIGLWGEGNADMRFGTNNSEAMRIDSSGNLLVGKTVQNIAVVGVTAVNGIVTATADGANAMRLNRKTSDGTIIDFRKDGTTVGSIGTSGGNPYFASGSVGLKLTTEVLPTDNNGASADGFLDLGGASDRFNNLYLSGGVYLGGTGSANKLDDYETGTFTPEVADAFSGGNTAAGGVFAGRYVKVGKLVTIQITLDNINTTGMTSGNLLVVRNIPFTTSSTNSSWVQPTFQNVSFTGQPTALLGNSRTYLYFREFSSGGTISDLSVSDFTSSSADVFLQLSFEV